MLQALPAPGGFLEEGAPGSAEGVRQGLEKGAGRQGPGAGWAGAGGWGQPLETQDGQQGPQRADRGELEGHSHRLLSGGRSRVLPGAGFGLGQVCHQGWLSAGPLLGISSLNLSLKGSLHRAAQLRRRPERR